MSRKPDGGGGLDLPAGAEWFVGRQAELARLTKHPPTVDWPLVVTGEERRAGVGKTALAVCAAHRLAANYPDGKLFLDMHGFTEGMEPLPAHEALDRVLRWVGVPWERIPPATSDRAALWRTIAADQRLLVVLDNVATEDQVIPLLPAASKSLFLVTGRHGLAGLGPRETVRLAPLPVNDAVALFERTAGWAASSADRSLVVEAVELCERVPLAVRIAAAQLRLPGRGLADLLHGLRDHAPSDRHGDSASGVGRAVEVACHRLTPDERNMYLVLGAHPGPDVDPHAAGALADTPVDRARELLGQLSLAILVEERAAGRYGFHDLVRAQAARAMREHGAGSTADASVGRLLTCYRQLAAAAMDAAHPYERERRPRLSVVDTQVHHFSDRDRAIAWLDAELPNLVAAARYAGAQGWADAAQDLAGTLHRHLRDRGRYREAEALHLQALYAARAVRSGEREIEALVGLGEIHRLRGRHETALVHFGRALRMARATGQRAAELDALRGLGAVHRRQGRTQEALEDFRQMLHAARALAQRPAELHALNGLGDIHRRQGRYEEAVDAFQRILEIAPEVGHGTGMLNALNGLGDVRSRQGRYDQALAAFRRTLELARATGHRPAELGALKGLADLWRRRGRYDEAEDHYRRLLDLAGESGDRARQLEAEHGLGLLHQAAARPAEALGHHRQALELAVELGEPSAQACAHNGLARVHQALDQPEFARRHWQLALELLAGLGLDQTEDEQASASAMVDAIASLERDP
jgi:tetratricopeptide (TPR) repeat protein